MTSRHERNEASILYFSREKLFEGVHMARVSLRHGENSTFHSHTVTRDTFYVMGGCLTIDIRVRDSAACYRGVYATPHETTIHGGQRTHRVRLKPGEVLVIDPGVVHCAMNLDENPCDFLCVEGVGTYDFIEA